MRDLELHSAQSAERTAAEQRHCPAVGDLSAVDDDLGAGDERRLVGDEIDDKWRHFVGLPGAPERRLGDVRRLERLGRRRGHRCVDEAGEDRVDADPARAELGARDARQAADAPFADGVGGSVVAGEPRDRADIHDRAAIGHQPRRGLDAEQRAREVDGEHAVPVGELDLVESCAKRDARVVDETVQRGRTPSASQPARPPSPRHARRRACGSDPGRWLCRLVVQVGRDHDCAFGGEGGGLRGSLPARRAGDDDDLAFHASHPREIESAAVRGAGSSGRFAAKRLGGNRMHEDLLRGPCAGVVFSC